MCRQLAESQATKRKKERLREEESSGGWWGWASSWATGAEAFPASGEEEAVVPSGKQMMLQQIPFAGLFGQTRVNSFSLLFFVSPFSGRGRIGQGEGQTVSCHWLQ